MLLARFPHNLGNKSHVLIILKVWNLNGELVLQASVQVIKHLQCQRKRSLA